MDITMDLTYGTEIPDLDVLIVGGGLSGLTSAIKILSKEKSLNLKIIDENSTLGGQLGEHSRFLHSDQHDMRSFLSLIHVLADFRMEDLTQRKRCWDLDRGLTALPAKFELCRYVKMLDLRMKKFASLRFQCRKRAPTMQNHICSNLFFNKSRQFMYNLVELACGVSAGEVNYDEFMCVCSSAGGLCSLINLYFAYPSTMLEVSGTDIIQGIKKKLGFIEVVQNRAVIAVKQYKNYVQVIDSANEKYNAQSLILAIPWNKVEKLDFEPVVPWQFRQLVRPLTQTNRLITQFHMHYKQSYWDAKGYSGSFLCSQPLVVGFVPKMAQSSYTGYMVHTAEEVGNVKEMVLDLLAAHFGEGMLNPEQYQQTSYELSVSTHRPQLKPWDRIIWSSSAAVATNDRNLMGGAVQSGMRAAIHALFVVRPQLVGWKDLLDMEEHQQYADMYTARLTGVLSRLNIYNVTFYGIFVSGLVVLLNFGYQRALD